MVLILKITTSHFDGEELYDKNGKMINILKILGTMIAIICFCSSVYRMAEDGKLCLFASDKEKNITYYGYGFAVIIGIIFWFVSHKFYLLIFSFVFLSITAWFLVNSYENNKNFSSTLYVFFTRVFLSLGMAFVVLIVLIPLLLYLSISALGKMSGTNE